MNLLSLVESRTATHNYDPNFKISDTDFLKIMEIVRHTPSGYNAQPWEFLLIQDPERLKELQVIAMNQAHITQSGNVIVVLGDKDFGINNASKIVAEWEKYRALPPNKKEGLKSSLLKKRDDWKKREMCIRNVSLSVMTFLIAAQEAGFATCPMMGVKQRDLKKFLDLPEHIMPIIIITLGKKSKTHTEPPSLPRKEAREISYKEFYGKHF